MTRPVRLNACHLRSTIPAGRRSGATCITLEGNIIEHQRADYYTFRDATGDIRIEMGFRRRYLEVDKLELR